MVPTEIIAKYVVKRSSIIFQRLTDFFLSFIIMQFFSSECLTLTGLYGFRYVRFHYVSAGQAIAVVPGHSPQFRPSFEELGSGRLTSSSHAHPRALLLAQQLFEEEERNSDKPGALVFLICAKCYVGSRGGREIVRRPLVWQFVAGHSGTADSLRPIRLKSTTDIQRGLELSAWEVVEELLGRCIATVAETEEMLKDQRLLNPFLVDLTSLRNLHSEEERAVAAGALVNFLWEVWSVTNCSSRTRIVSGRMSCTDYLTAVWEDVSALCDAHFISLSHVLPSLPPSSPQAMPAN